MTDAVLLFDPGFQVLNSSGTPQSGAIIRAYDAGTSSPRVLYSDPTLTTSLGSSVTCNSAGRPASGSTEVLLYASEGNLLLTAETSTGSSLWSYDNVAGAIDTSGFAGGSGSTTYVTNISLPCLAKSADYTVTTSDVGRIINVNSSAVSTIITLPNAATAGDGFIVGIRNIHATGRVVIDAVSTQLIDGQAALTLRYQYEMVWLDSDGANWHTISHSTPLRTGRLPFLSVKSRVQTSPPATATDGDRYIVDGTGGAWSTLDANDIAEKDGVGGWLEFDPSEGWLAWVEDENRMVQYNGTRWVCINGQMLVTEGTVATANSIDLNLGQWTWARGFEIEVYNAQPSVDASVLSMRWASDTALSYIAASTYEHGSAWATAGDTGGGQFDSWALKSDTKMIMIGADTSAAVGNAAGEGADIGIKIMNTFVSTNRPRCVWQGVGLSPGTNLVTVTGAGCRTAVAKVRGVRIAFATFGGNAAASTISGSYAVYAKL